MTSIREWSKTQHPDYEWVYIIADKFSVSGEGSIDYNPHELLQLVAEIRGSVQGK